LFEDTQRILGLEHPGFAATINNLAFLYFKAGEYAKAEPLYQQALLIRQKSGLETPTSTPRAGAPVLPSASARAGNGCSSQAGSAVEE